jgi:hypothetical protein
LAAQRLATMEEFLRAFYLEWEGNDADPNPRAAKSSRLLDAFAKRTIQVGDCSRRVPAPILQPDPIE